MRLRRLTILAALMLPLFGTAAQAQQPAASLSAQPAELAAGARLRIPERPLLSPGQTGPSLELVAARPTKRTGRTLMIVGGAVLLVGLLADETIVSVAGVGIGAYGLYVYLDDSPKRR